VTEQLEVPLQLLVWQMLLLQVMGVPRQVVLASQVSP